MECNKCGARLTKGWRFCPDCGSSTEPVLVPEEQLKLFTKVFGDGHMEYRYGPEFEAAVLQKEGGYDTPEEAKQAWEEMKDGRAVKKGARRHRAN